jgi:GntR family transcriptional regulator of gluconate operon
LATSAQRRSSLATASREASANADDERLGIPQIGFVVAQRLRERILSGALPAGERITEVELAKRYGVSRGPIRDALKELARESLVVALPRRGVVVSGLSAADVEEVYAVREALERLALDLAAQRAQEAEFLALGAFVAGMEESVRAGDVQALIANDLGFHRGICRLAGNRRLLSMWEELAPQSAVIIGLSSALEERLARGVDPHHQAVLDGLRARNPKRAADILAEHFADSKARMLAALGGPSTGQDSAPKHRAQDGASRPPR